jgi:hypothetical protein
MFRISTRMFASLFRRRALGVSPNADHTSWGAHGWRRGVVVADHFSLKLLISITHTHTLSASLIILSPAHAHMVADGGARRALTSPGTRSPYAAVAVGGGVGVCWATAHRRGGPTTDGLAGELVGNIVLCPLQKKKKGRERLRTGARQKGKTSSPSLL